MANLSAKVVCIQRQPVRGGLWGGARLNNVYIFYI